MKILMLFPYAPQPPPLDLAGTKRNLPFALELARYHDVTVLSFGTAEQRERFENAYGERFSEVRFVDRSRPRILNGLERLWLLATGRSTFRQLYHPEMQRAIDEMTETTGFDVIHCCVQMFGYFRFPGGIPVSSDTHEVKYDLLRRNAERATGLRSKILNYLSYRFGKREEIELCGRFDLLFATTERDRELFARDLPDQRIEVIQNGAGDTFFEDLGIDPEPHTLCFTGLFTHFPNRDGIRFFLDDVFPLVLREVPDARIFVVGKSPGPELRRRASDNVIVTGFVDDVRPFMARSQVFVIPLRAGGGIRGKALEAMAMRRPIVTTTIGVEGIHLRDGESALFADTAEDFAEAVVRLLRDESLWHRLATSSFRVATRCYRWEARGKDLGKALTRLVGTRPEARPGSLEHPGHQQNHISGSI